MQNIKNIIFDLGNVLLDLELPNIEHGFRQLFGDDYAKAGAELKKNQIFELYETGGLSTEEFVDAIRMSVTPHLLPEQVIGVWNSIFRTMPTERFDMLLRLRQNYKVFLLSNINDLHANWIDDYMLREHNLDGFQSIYFDGVYYSHLIRLRKPNADAYEYVLADAEIKAEESVFIDDLQVNIAAAANVGIHTIWHDGEMDIIERMKVF
jgi:putative hydrolase of the HAD superfamily